MLVGLVPLQDRPGEGGLVGGVGEVLGLQAEGVAGTIGAAALSPAACFQEVGGIELHAGLGGMDLHGDAGIPGIGPGGGAQGARLPVHHIVVVIAVTLHKLVEVLLNMGADGGGGLQVHGGALHGDDGAKGDALGVAGGVGLGEELDLLVEKRFVRLDSEDPFESWDGYAMSGTEVFDNVYLRGEAIANLGRNTKVTVLEGKGDWLQIEWDGGSGYVDASKISKWYINSGSGSSGGSSGGSSAPADGSDVPLDRLSARDFQAELTLLGAYYGPEMEEELETGMGAVLAQDVEAYICLLLRDDEAKVTEYDEETITIWLENDLYAQLPRWLLRLEGDEEYESWTGYSKWSGKVYEEYQMRNVQMTLTTNKQVTVLDELPDCYVVEVDGQIGYMELGDVSANRYVTSGGGSSGGGSSSGDTWTPRKM